MPLDREHKRTVAHATSKRLVLAGGATLEDAAAGSSDGGRDLSSLETSVQM